MTLVDTIYRFTNPNDELADLGPTEKIEFNTGSVPDATGRLVSSSFAAASDLNPHPNPDVQLNPIQDSLLGVLKVVIAGYFVNHNNTLGPRNLLNWSIDPDTNNNFRFGRFGLDVNTMNEILNVTPTVGLNGTGYMLADVYVEDVEDPRTEVPFIATLFRNGAITTIPP